MSLLLAILSISSCSKVQIYEVDKIVFGKDGGTQTTKVNPEASTLTILDENGNHGRLDVVQDEGSSMCIAETDWLYAELDRYSGVITLKAKRNDTGRSRSLKIHCMVRNSGASLQVIQE